jgi:hypothetical protein
MSSSFKLCRPEFMEPNPCLSYKTNSTYSILGKRKYDDAFGKNKEVEGYDDQRYGQHIGATFFDTHYGHGVYVENYKVPTNTPVDKKNNFKDGEKEILEWCEYYLANRNFFKV